MPVFLFTRTLASGQMRFYQTGGWSCLHWISRWSGAGFWKKVWERKSVFFMLRWQELRRSWSWLAPLPIWKKNCFICPDSGTMSRSFFQRKQGWMEKPTGIMCCLRLQGTVVWMGFMRSLGCFRHLRILFMMIRRNLRWKGLPHRCLPRQRW